MLRSRPRIIRGDDDGDGKRSNSNLENKICLIRAPLLEILTVEKEEQVCFRPFVSPVIGHVAGKSAAYFKKTLGCRLRPWNSVSIKPFETIQEYKSEGLSIGDELDKNIEPLILFEPSENDPPQLNNKIEVDPMLTRWLREHQRIGVQFMFDCLTGRKGFDGMGCILADDMGLGKTLQSITVIWTLMTQGFDGAAICNRALVVCPSSLVGNWSAEVTKWLGNRCKCTAVNDTTKDKVISKVEGFKYDYKSKILIMSYESFRTHEHRLKGVKIDLIVADEAHRLKNDKTKIALAIMKLPTQRRLLISGTPIQNDLGEFFSLVSLCNPKVLGDAVVFRKSYANPILAGREPNATKEERLIAQERLLELSSITNSFILRRTNAILTSVLPPKLILNLFCCLTPEQTRLYQAIIQSATCAKLVGAAEKGGEISNFNGRILAMIQKLMKLCNHPFLLRNGSNTQITNAKSSEDPINSQIQSILNDIQRTSDLKNKQAVLAELSGKMLFVKRLLNSIKKLSDDRVVIISNYTQSLDLLEQLGKELNYPIIRLDGSIHAKKRQELVNTFNDRNAKAFIFLLSSKAGGCGINLVGANRLIMFDPDWNPANDKQALARIWRDGQKKTCYIYRLFSTGTIEEKVFQRQISKDGLSSMMIVSDGDNQMKGSLSAEYLKDLFTLREDTASDTHDTLHCQKCTIESIERGEDINADEAGVEEDLLTWGHFYRFERIPDEALRDTVGLVNHNELVSTKDFQPLTFAMTCWVDSSRSPVMQDKIQETSISREMIEKNALIKRLRNDTNAGSIREGRLKRKRNQAKSLVDIMSRDSSVSSDTFINDLSDVSSDEDASISTGEESESD